MTGATAVAAQIPDIASDANRRPKFFVFHTFDSVKVDPPAWAIGLICVIASVVATGFDSRIGNGRTCNRGFIAISLTFRV
jgi:hypothetical protein